MSGAPFELAFVGAGVSTLLALRALAAGRPGTRVLVVEPTPASPEHTYAYWSARPTSLDALVHATYDALDVKTPGTTARAHLGAHRLRVLKLGALQRAATEAAHALDVTVVKDGARAVWSDERAAFVDVGGVVYEAGWALDARPPDDPDVEGARTTLVQSFHGMTARLVGADVDRAVPLFMDFRMPPDGDGVLFGYVLPLDDERAFVETVRISARGRPPPDPDLYAARVLGAARVEVESVEAGATLLSDGRFPRHPSPRVTGIGMRGGRLKPSTGYALTRMLGDAEALMGAFAAGRPPLDDQAGAATSRFLDSVMLEVMARTPDALPGIMAALFAGNPGDRVLAFLDEESTALDMAALIATLPAGPFLDVLRGRAGA